MNSLQKQIDALRERVDQLELAVWSLETSDKRNWDLIRQIDDKLSARVARLEKHLDRNPMSS